MTEPIDPDAVPQTDTPTRVKIRGIYTTGLTRLLLAADHEVVRASPPIRRRFDATFPVTPESARITTTTDRQGVGVHGTPAAVTTLRRLLDRVGVDTLSWQDPTPRGAIFDGRVTETTGGGAVVALGTDDPPEGYLPFDVADGYVETGDSVRVQVREPAAPWTDDRPRLDTRLHADGGIVTLVRGREEPRVAGGDAAAARELAGMTDLLDVDTPDGWGIEWARDATGADMDALAAGLDRASDRARALDDATDRGPENPRRLDRESEQDGPRPEAGETDSPNASDGTDGREMPDGTDEQETTTAGAWVWFGRTSRGQLDAHRRRVTTTMPGHHRIKAGSRAASAGVDFAERVAEFDADAPFPFAAVTEQFGPSEGDDVRLVHGKPDGRAFSLGRATVTSLDAEGNVTLERTMRSSGTYDGLGTRREQGDTAVTKLREDRWWYPTTYRGTDGTSKGTYVNVCTPVEVFPDAVRYVDLHVDVVKRPDGTVERVDDQELDDAVAARAVPEELAERARSVAAAVVRALSE